MHLDIPNERTFCIEIQTQFGMTTKVLYSDNAKGFFLLFLNPS